MKINKMTLLAGLTLLSVVFTASPMQNNDKRDIRKEWSDGRYKIIETDFPLISCPGCGQKKADYYYTEFFGMDKTNTNIILKGPGLCDDCIKPRHGVLAQFTIGAYNIISNEIVDTSSLFLLPPSRPLVSNYSMKQYWIYDSKIEFAYSISSIIFPFIKKVSGGIINIHPKDYEVELIEVENLKTKHKTNMYLKNGDMEIVEGTYRSGGQQGSDICVVSVRKREDPDFEWHNAKQQLVIIDPRAFTSETTTRSERYLHILTKPESDTASQKVFVNSNGTLIGTYNPVKSKLTVFKLLDHTPGLCVKPENRTKFAKSHDLFWRCK